MSKVLVKAIVTDYAIDGTPQYRLTNQGSSARGKTKREIAGSALGGTVGALGALAGKHRSLGSLVQGMVSGYSQGKQLGGGAGRILVSPERQAVVDYRRGQRLDDAARRAPDVPTAARRVGRGVGRLQNFANRFKRTPAEEVAVTPAEEVAATPESHLLTGKPPEVAVESPYSMAGAPLLLGPGDWTEEEIPDDPRTNASDIAVNPERGVSTEVPKKLPRGSLGDFGIPKKDRVRVERPAPTMSTATNRADMFGGQTYVKHPSRTELPAYDKRETPLSVPEQGKKEDMQRFYETANLQAANVAQSESDAALQANAAALNSNKEGHASAGAGAASLPNTPFTIPTLSASGGSSKALADGDNPASVLTTPATDHKDGAGPPAPPAPPVPPVPPVSPVGLTARQKIQPSLDVLGVGEEEEGVTTSVDRLPVVAIRKARRRVLVV